MKLLFGIVEAGETIRHNKLRTILTMLGMNIGVASIISIIAIGLMTRSSIMESTGILGASQLTVNPEWQHYSGEEMVTQLTPDDARYLQEFIPEATVLPYLIGYEAISAQGLTEEERVMGVSSSYNEVWMWQIASGRFLDAGDFQLRRKAAVLGSRAVNQYFSETDPLGKTIHIGKTPYTVVGVLQPRGKAVTNDGSDDSTIFIPLQTYQIFYDYSWYGKPYLDQMIIKVNNLENLDTIVSAVEIYLFSKYGLIGDKNRFNVSRNQDQINTVNKVFDVITLVISLIAGLSLLVSGMGIMNIMLVGITERIREIGIRKSLGATMWDILEQFLMEAIIICLLGGGVGVILGLLVSSLVAIWQGWAFILPVSGILAGLGISIGIGVFFGIYPAMRAARMDPVRALSRD